ncbi:HutD family protein, partial [Klebsiella pneumoniae]
IVAPGLDFNIMTQPGRASATVQVVSDLQCPASEGVAYVLQGEWDLAGRRCAAGSGLCWRGGSPRYLRPVGSNGRLLLAEIALT